MNGFLASGWFSAWLLGLGVSLAWMTLFWVVSLRRRDAGVADLAWGPGFVLLAWLYRGFGPPSEPHHLLLLAVVTIWGLRLAVHLLRRNLREVEEDRRYAAMREARGPAFRWQSLFLVFWLQGALIALIATPLLVAQLTYGDGAWGWTESLGLLLWIVGFVFEAGGDAQLTRFRSDPANRGTVLDTGLWRFTRHPNYFGDFLQHWGFFVIALETPLAWWALPAPILMSVLLMRVSGVSLLERDISERRPAYRHYIESTNAFFPGRPSPDRPRPVRREPEAG